MSQLTKRDYKYKKILIKNVMYYNKRGLECFSNPVDKITKSSKIKKYFIEEVGSYWQHCEITGYHIKECRIPTKPLPTLPRKYISTFNEHHFLLHKLKSEKVIATFTGTQAKCKFPRQF